MLQLDIVEQPSYLSGARRRTMAPWRPERDMEKERWLDQAAAHLGKSHVAKTYVDKLTPVHLAISQRAASCTLKIQKDHT